MMRRAEFQSTRPSRASTQVYANSGAGTYISIHKALAGLDRRMLAALEEHMDISIHKALAGLDYVRNVFGNSNGISIHKALAGLDQLSGVHTWKYAKFQSTRPSRASTL